MVDDRVSGFWVDAVGGVGRGVVWWWGCDVVEGRGVGRDG